MPALAKCLNLLDGQIEDTQFELAFVPNVLPEWEAQYREVRQLLQSFEQDMSPRTLVYQMGFREDGQNEYWLASVMHQLWLARYPVRQWIEHGTVRARAADAAYLVLRKSLHGCHDLRLPESNHALRDTLATFRERCQELAQAIEQFPSEIKVT